MNEIEFKIGWAQLAMHCLGSFVAQSSVFFSIHKPADRVVLANRRAAMLLLDDMFALWVLTKAFFLDWGWTRQTMENSQAGRAKTERPTVAWVIHYISIWAVFKTRVGWWLWEVIFKRIIIIIQLGSPFFTNQFELSCRFCATRSRRAPRHPSHVTRRGDGAGLLVHRINGWVTYCIV